MNSREILGRMSAWNHSNTNSSEDDDPRYAMIVDEKKRKRMISNRESARRSRMKREQRVKDLNDQVARFRTRSSDLVRKIDELSQRYAAVESENRFLRMHGEEMKRRLEFLEGMLSSATKNYSDEYSSVMDILQEPAWLLQPQATVGIYQF